MKNPLGKCKKRLQPYQDFITNTTLDKILILTNPSQEKWSYENVTMPPIIEEYSMLLERLLSQISNEQYELSNIEILRFNTVWKLLNL